MRITVAAFLVVAAFAVQAQAQAQCNQVCVGNLTGHVSQAEVRHQCCMVSLPGAVATRSSKQCVTPAASCPLYVARPSGSSCLCATPRGPSPGKVR